MNVHLRSVRLAALLVATVVVGCTGDATPAPTPAQTTETAATPRVTAIPAEPSPGAVAEELEVTDDPLLAGTYTRTGFVPIVTLELDGTWRAVGVFNQLISLQHGPDGPDAVTVEIIKPDWAYGPNAIPVQEPDAQTALDAISVHEALVEIESSTSRIGGLDGLQLTVENQSADDAWIIHAAPGDLKVPAGRRSWIASFDTRNGLVMIFVGGPVIDWDAALRIAEPVLESIVFAQ